jgi:hypothetical protein
VIIQAGASPAGAHSLSYAGSGNLTIGGTLALNQELALWVGAATITGRITGPGLLQVRSGVSLHGPNDYTGGTRFGLDVNQVLGLGSDTASGASGRREVYPSPSTGCDRARGRDCRFIQTALDGRQQSSRELANSHRGVGPKRACPFSPGRLILAA